MLHVVSWILDSTNWMLDGGVWPQKHPDYPHLGSFLESWLDPLDLDGSRGESQKIIDF